MSHYKVQPLVWCDNPERIQMDILEDSVMIGYVHPNVVTEGFTRSLAGACLWRDNKIVGIVSAANPRHHVARNEVIKKFLESPAEWLMWIDTDMTFEHECIDRLRETAAAEGADIVAGLAFIFKRLENIVQPNMYLWDTDINKFAEIRDYESGEVLNVDAVGSAFVLINRRVFEAWDDEGWHQNWMEHPASGEAMGHDLAFFYQACIEQDFKLVYDTDIQSGHIKHFELNEETFRDWQEMKA